MMPLCKCGHIEHGHIIVRPDLTAANEARLKTQLDKLVRFDGIVRTWAGHLKELDFVYRVERTSNPAWDTGKVTVLRGFILRADADEEIGVRGMAGLDYATFHEAPKLIVDNSELPLVIIDPDGTVHVDGITYRREML